MDKREFLETLRLSLNGEVDSEVIEQNIKYYDDYINTSTTEAEERILGELGDARLIARTIIESDKAAKHKVKYAGNQSNHSNYYTENENKQNNKKQPGNGHTGFYTNIKWYHKIAFVFAFVLFIVVIAFLGKLLFSILFAFAVPIILVLLVLALFRRR